MKKKSKRRRLSKRRRRRGGGDTELHHGLITLSSFHSIFSWVVLSFVNYSFIFNFLLLLPLPLLGVGVFVDWQKKKAKELVG